MTINQAATRFWISPGRTNAKERQCCTPPQPATESEQDVKRQLLEDALQKSEKLAESGVEMATLFIQSGKKAIARRRLKEIIKGFGQSQAAREARALLAKL